MVEAIATCFVIRLPDYRFFDCSIGAFDLPKQVPCEKSKFRCCEGLRVRIRPVSGVGKKGAESSGRQRHIRCPLKPDVQIPRILFLVSPTKMATF